MLSLIAHGDGVGRHGALWLHWADDPTVMVGLALAGCAYALGRPRRSRSVDRRAQAFWIGFAAVFVAVASPLDAMAGELASAHMVQHLLLVVVAAPLLAYSAPIPRMLRGMPRAVRSPLGRTRRSMRRSSLLVQLRRPGVAWFLHATTLWFWHASGPYGAALDHDIVHGVEHLSFLLTASFFWSTVLQSRGAPRTSEGYAVILVFTMAMQGVFLGALLTFATSPWYDGYRESTVLWGFDPLADQQLAGVVMWVPAGLVYVAVGVGLTARWIRGSDGGTDDWTVGHTPERDGPETGDEDRDRHAWSPQPPEVTRTTAPPTYTTNMR